MEDNFSRWDRVNKFSTAGWTPPILQQGKPWTQSAITNDTTRPEIVAGTQFHAEHGTKFTLVLLPADGEAPWSLMEPEKTYSYILNVTCQA